MHTFFRGHRYSFLRIDLPTDEEVLSALPDRVFIGLANKGTDENYLVFDNIPSGKYTAPDDAAFLVQRPSSRTPDGTA